MAILSPDERTYCLNVGDTIAIELQFADPQPDKVWYRVVDGSHCPLGFCQNPYQAPIATEIPESGSGSYFGTSYTVANNNHHNAHVLFWWIYPNDTLIQFDNRDFSIAPPGSDSCSGITVALLKRGKKGPKPEAKKSSRPKKSGRKPKSGKATKRAKA